MNTMITKSSHSKTRQEEEDEREMREVRQEVKAYRARQAQLIDEAVQQAVEKRMAEMVQELLKDERGKKTSSRRKKGV